jgi:hypothetical protein
MLLCHALTVKKMIRNNKHTEINRENVPSVINNEIQSTCVPNEKQKEKEDITVVNDDLDTKLLFLSSAVPWAPTPKYQTHSDYILIPPSTKRMSF